MKGKGCRTCNGTGYKGQVGLYEGSWRSRTGSATSSWPERARPRSKWTALEEGMLTLCMSGLEKIKHGVTTVEEVVRETVL